jgi:hypothetical protein
VSVVDVDDVPAGGACPRLSAPSRDETSASGALLPWVRIPWPVVAPEISGKAVLT